MSKASIPFDHLERMTDDTGLIEHSLGRIPRRKEGYSTDDNARGIWTCIEWLKLLGDNHSTESRRLYRLLDRYLAFLLWAQHEDGWFQNNFHYDRTPETESRSEDCFGRSFWAAAVVYVHLDDEARVCVASEILKKALPASQQLRFLRGQAWVLAASSLLLTRKKEHGNHTALDEGALRNLAAMYEENLINAYKANQSSEWKWFEPQMTYANGLLPWALFMSFRVQKRQETMEAAKDSLDFLISKMDGKDGVIRPIGNRGWCDQQKRAIWDQQPVDVMKLCLAAKEAYQELKEPNYLNVVRRCSDWFYGKNDLRLPLADPSDGSCQDGLNQNGVNPNRGAESTLSYLLTEAFAHSLLATDEAVSSSPTA